LNSSTTLGISLYLFTKQNNTDLVKPFLELGANANFIVPKGYYRNFGYASHNKNVDVVYVVLKLCHETPSSFRSL
jgi:hypothetical protein